MDENVKLVPKEINPPNIFQARPIENFVESLFQRVKAKVKSIGDNGVYALFK